MQAEAIFDPTGKYRYTLSRTWDAGQKRVAFLMLNPSTADAEVTDPTIRSCLGFARELGFGSMEVVNLFAYRAAEPAKLKRARSPIGRDNDLYIVQACNRADAVVLAWGNHGLHRERGAQVEMLLRDNNINSLWCLGKTLQGQPKHPLYVRRTTELVQWTL